MRRTLGSMCDTLMGMKCPNSRLSTTGWVTLQGDQQVMKLRLSDMASLLYILGLLVSQCWYSNQKGILVAVCDTAETLWST
jgi:hypothetical protein